MKVGVIAAVGFGVGVVWPRLAGIHLGPNAPGESAASLVASGAPANPAGVGTAVGARDALAERGGAAAARGEPAGLVASDLPATGRSVVTIAKTAVLSCKTDTGESLKGVASCGSVPAFDALATTRLKKLAQCPAAGGALGKLSVVVGADFASNRVTVNIGKSSTVDNQDSFASCLVNQFQNVALGPIPHDNPRYRFLYELQLGPARGPFASNALSGAATGSSVGAVTAAPIGAPAHAADDENAQVMWEVAIVRDAPRTGQVIGRLQRGTKLKVEKGPEAGWFRVRFPGGDGWIYRGSIGR